MGFREFLFLQYHNSMLGGHCGRERTVSKLTRDWWWLGLYESVRKWCALCRLCQPENALVSLSAHARTELYSRPFRVIQFDTIKCESQAEDTHTKYVLTAICAFSRYCWLIPLDVKSAPIDRERVIRECIPGPCRVPDCPEIGQRRRVRRRGGVVDERRAGDPASDRAHVSSPVPGDR